MSDRSEKAREVSNQVGQKVSSLIVQLAQERLKAQQTAGAALDQRCAQMVGFQLIAVTISATLSRGADPTAIFAAIACLVFLSGAIVAAFGGVRPDSQHLPGQNPSWWYGAPQEPKFTLGNANTWISVCAEEMIEFNNKRSDRRARFLDASVWLAVAGGVVLAFAALARLWTLVCLPPGA